ncbi:O-antigen ligase family protein [Pelagibacteraceae bacterium]|nr:O-antigen ligase family protein [Pelagibacteraceae bacterium]
MNLFINKNPITFFSILFCLMPAALITGPFISDLFLSMIALYFIIISVIEKNIKYYQNQFFFFFLAFYFYILIGSIISKSPINSLESSLFYFRYIFFTFGAMYLIEKNPKIILYFGYSIFITIFIVTLDAYFQFFTESNILGYEKWSNGRFSGLLKDEALGRYLVYLMPLMFAVLSMKKNIKKSEIIIAMIILILADIIIFLSGERTAFALLTLGTVIIIFNIKKYKYIRALSFLISIFIIILFTLNYPQVKNRIVDQTMQGFNFGSENVNIINIEYDTLYKTAYNIFLDNPLKGIGVKNFRVICKDQKYDSYYSCSTHPHNTFLQFLAETGIIGTLFYLLALSICIFKLLMNFVGIMFNKQNLILEDYMVCLYACYVVILWPLSPSLNFFNNWISVIYYLPLPFLLQNIKKL